MVGGQGAPADQVSMDEDDCGHMCGPAHWPICALPIDHAGDHESADFRWSDKDTEPSIKTD